MKYTLLEMVNKVMPVDSDLVSTISDSTEAIQVSSIIEDQYFLMVSNRVIPEHKELIKLTAASDSTFPTHFRYPSQVSSVERVWYATDDVYSYKELTWLEPEDFLKLTDGLQSNYVATTTKVGGTALRVNNNAMPTYYTSFDDDWIVMNSYKATVDTTLQESKSRASVVKLPTWSPHDDTFIPDIDDQYFSLLIQESKVVALSELKNGGDVQVADRAASRSRAALQQGSSRKNKKEKAWSHYGR